MDTAISRDLKALGVRSLARGIIYLLVASAYGRLFDTNASVLLILVVLIVARSMFGVCDALARIAAWHLYVRRVLMQVDLRNLQTNEFPRPKSGFEPVLSYLWNVRCNEMLPTDKRLAAAHMYSDLQGAEAATRSGYSPVAAAQAALSLYAAMDRCIPTNPPLNACLPGAECSNGGLPPI